MINLKRILKITGWALLISILIVFLLVVLDNSQKNDSKENTDLEMTSPLNIPSLEEIADKTLQTIEDLIPEPKESLSLEEQAEMEGKDISDFIPEPIDDVPLLEKGEIPTN